MQLSLKLNDSWANINFSVLNRQLKMWLNESAITPHLPEHFYFHTFIIFVSLPDFFFLFISGPASQLICFQYSIIGFLLDMFWIHGFYVKSLNNGPHISCLINQMYGREAWFLSSHGQGGQFIFCFYWNHFTHWGNVFWVKWNLCHPLLLGLPSSIILGFSFGSPETPLWYLAPLSQYTRLKYVIINCPLFYFSFIANYLFKVLDNKHLYFFVPIQ